jgi:hypothetical protein
VRCPPPARFASIGWLSPSAITRSQPPVSSPRAPRCADATGGEGDVQRQRTGRRERPPYIPLRRSQTAMAAAEMTSPPIPRPQKAPADEGAFGRYQEPDKSISTWKGTVALISPVNTSPSRYRLLAESSR